MAGSGGMTGSAQMLCGEGQLPASGIVSSNSQISNSGISLSSTVLHPGHGSSLLCCCLSCRPKGQLGSFRSMVRAGCIGMVGHGCIGCIGMGAGRTGSGIGMGAGRTGSGIGMGAGRAGSGIGMGAGRTGSGWIGGIGGIGFRTGGLALSKNAVQAGCSSYCWYCAVNADCGNSCCVGASARFG